MRYFHYKLKNYDLVEQIYLLVGERPFTYIELVENGIDIVPASLVDLRNRGVITHLLDPTAPPGIARPLYAPGKERTKIWVFTPEGIETIRRERGEETK